MSETLRECPFCGSVMETKYYANMGYIVYCTNEDDCPGNMEFWETEREAITAWNTRPIEDELQAKWDAIPWKSLRREMLFRDNMMIINELNIDHDHVVVMDWFAANAPKEPTK